MAVEDFAALAVATFLHKEEEGCLMHNFDKIPRWGVGMLQRTKKKVLVGVRSQTKCDLDCSRMPWLCMYGPCTLNCLWLICAGSCGSFP